MPDRAEPKTKGGGVESRLQVENCDPRKQKTVPKGDLPEPFFILPSVLSLFVAQLLTLLLIGGRVYPNLGLPPG